MRDDVVEQLGACLIYTIEVSPWLVLSLGLAILWKVAHEFPSACDSLQIVLEDFVGHARYLTVHLGTTELLLGDLLVCDSLDDLRASHEHVTRVLYHEDKVSESGRVNRTAGTRSHDKRDLWDHSR